VHGAMMMMMMMMMMTGLPATCKAVYMFEYSDHGKSHVAFDA
jgi:hypothetical protein